MDDPFVRIIWVEFLPSPSTILPKETTVLSTHSSPSWMDTILAYLQEGNLPEDKKEAEKIRRKSPRYWVSEEGKLYERSYSGLYLLCVHPEAINVLLEELHEGICGSYMRGRSLAHMAFTQVY